MSPSTHTPAADLHLNESSSMVPVPEELEAVDSSRSAYTGAVTIGRSRKRKRTTQNLALILSACDLLRLQQEVLCKQLDVFSAQLDLIEEQREYYRLIKEANTFRKTIIVLYSPYRDSHYMQIYHKSKYIKI